MPADASQGTGRQEGETHYAQSSLKGLAGRFGRVLGVPREATLPLAVVAFATVPVPTERRRFLLAVIESLRTGRDWSAVIGENENASRAEGSIKKLEKELRPPLWMCITDTEGKPSLHFKQLTDGTGTSKKTDPALGAFVYQAIGVLEAFGHPLRRRIRDEIAASRAGKVAPRPSSEIVSMLLDIVGLTPNARTHRQRRTANTVIAEYTRQKNLISSDMFTVSVGDNQHRSARFATGQDIVNFIGPGVKAAIRDPENRKSLRRRIWIPI